MARRRSYLLVTFCCIIILVASFSFGYFMYSTYYHSSKNMKNNPQPNAQTQVPTDPIQDQQASGSAEQPEESDEESLGLQNEPTVNNENDEKITADTQMILKKKYLEDNQEATEEKEIEKDMIGLTEAQLQAVHPEWNIESFNSKEIIISQEIEGKRPQHYILKEKDGKIAVYYQTPVDGKSIKEELDIDIRQLRQEDQERLRKGIEVNSDEELAQFIEDFTS